MSLYALRSPKGRLIEETLAISRTECWGKAFPYLSGIYPDFAHRFWKRWEASTREARKRGWRITKVKISEDSK